MDLTKCIYENIKDTFYYGLFGDFRLVIDTATGYFNATKLCVEGGKRFREWKILENENKFTEISGRGPDHLGGCVVFIYLFFIVGLQFIRNSCFQESWYQFYIFHYQAYYISVCRSDHDIPHSPCTL